MAVIQFSYVNHEENVNTLFNLLASNGYLFKAMYRSDSFVVVFSETKVITTTSGHSNVASYIVLDDDFMSAIELLPTFEMKEAFIFSPSFI